MGRGEYIIVVQNGTTWCDYDKSLARVNEPPGVSVFFIRLGLLLTAVAWCIFVGL